jgi:hypothetical protein
MRRSDALVGVGVGADAAVLTLVERIDRGDLLGGEIGISPCWRAYSGPRIGEQDRRTGRSGRREMERRASGAGA